MKRLETLDVLFEAAKELKRQGDLVAHAGRIFVLVRFLRVRDDGSVERLVDIGKVWQGWRRRS